ncbi:MAG: deoxyribodipyrimidine photo-lyase, partial [Bacteroidota bacterium]|nr:deoxyribodipyrimidine photo-lyase [Bacteroidota bacterium]
MKTTVNIFWFRRDLRLDDNTGLYYCLKEGLPVLPIFIFDCNILDQLENHHDPRVEFIFKTVEDLQRKLISHGSSLEVFYGKPMEVFVSLIDTYEIGKVFTNEDYEPYARERDSDIESLLTARGIGFRSFKDHVIFSKQEILKDDGLPYTVFTPYSNKWMALLKKPETDFLGSFQVEKYLRNLFQHKGKPLPLLSSMGFSASGCIFPSSHPDPELIGKYNRQRDFPGLD